MAEHKVRVKVPKNLGDRFFIRHSGFDPVEYNVKDGHVNVDPRNIQSFLSSVPGSTRDEGDSTATGTTGSTKKERG
jgi:hypothetical protein